MNRAPSEDLHNSLLASQDLAFFEEIHKKAFRDKIRECYDDPEGCQTLTEDFLNFLSSISSVCLSSSCVIL